MNIVTWNTQGDPRNDQNKLTQLDYYLQNFDYVLIQEAGALAGVNNLTINYINYSVIGAGQVGAYNNRCGTAILTRRNFDNANFYTLPNSTGRFGITVRDSLTDTYVSTLHSESSPRAAYDRSSFCKYLYESLGADARIIIGGDFNCNPPVNPYNVNTTSRPYLWSISSTNQATQLSGYELDYFLYNNLIITNLNIGPTLGNRFTGGSDHKSIMINF